MISYCLSWAVSHFTALCKLIWFMKGVESDLEERRRNRGKGGGYAIPYAQPLKADDEPWLPDDFSVFVNALLSSFPKDYLQLLSFPWIVFSSLVPEGSISLNVFHRRLLFVSNLDLTTVGYRVSSSQLSGISWLMLAYPQSFSLLQFTSILGWSGDPEEWTSAENWGPENAESREGIRLGRYRESLKNSGP